MQTSCLPLPCPSRLERLESENALLRELTELEQQNRWLRVSTSREKGADTAA